MRTSRVVLNIVSGTFSVLVLLLIVFVFIKVGNTAYDLGYRIFTEPAVENAPGRDVLVEVEQGMTAMELGKLLEEKRLVDNSALFAIQLKLSVYAKDIKPGIYTLNTSQTSREMMQVMAKEETEEAEE